MINWLIFVPQLLGLLFCMVGAIMLALHRTSWFEGTRSDIKAEMANNATILLSIGFTLQLIAFGLNWI